MFLKSLFFELKHCENMYELKGEQKWLGLYMSWEKAQMNKISYIVPVINQN